MKTYVIMLAKKFPKGHVHQGRITDFNMKINIGIKIHTIRKNYRLWEKRFIEIDKGNACISVRIWADKPYRSKQIELFNFDSTNGIGIEKLYFRTFNTVYEGKELPEGLYQRLQIETTDKKHYCIINPHEVSKNDGLSPLEFTKWFPNTSHSLPFAIIHFTKFRYND